MAAALKFELGGAAYETVLKIKNMLVKARETPSDEDCEQILMMLKRDGQEITDENVNLAFSQLRIKRIVDEMDCDDIADLLEEDDEENAVGSPEAINSPFGVEGSEMYCQGEKIE